MMLATTSAGSMLAAMAMVMAGRAGERVVAIAAQGRPHPPPMRHAVADAVEHLFGLHATTAAVVTGSRVIHRAFVAHGLGDSGDVRSRRLLAGLQDRGVTAVTRVDAATLSSLAGDGNHQGVVLRVAPLTVGRLDAARAPAVPLSLVLDEVVDPRNLAALLRCAVFFGVDRVVMAPRNCAPLSPLVSAASVGALELLAARGRIVVAGKPLPATLADMAASGVVVLGAAAMAAAPAVPTVSTAVGDGGTAVELVAASSTMLGGGGQPQPVYSPDDVGALCRGGTAVALVMGNEGRGLRTNVLRACAGVATVHRSGFADDAELLVDSLNVSVAAGVLLHSCAVGRKAMATPPPPLT